MNKPIIKREIAIAETREELGRIYFYASAAAASDLSQYGRVAQDGDRFYLRVNGRYDFCDIVAYIENYG